MRNFKLQMPEAIKAALPESTLVCRIFNADEGPITLAVMDDIGTYGVSATDVSDFLAENRSRDLTVKINSFGGDVYDGLSIANDLSQHEGHVTTVVNGVAYSAATPIFLAGDDREMHEAADFGIHRAWAGAVGNQKVMLAMADWLNTIDQHLVELYDSFTNAGEDQVNEWMDGKDGMSGTVFSAKGALEAGFASKVIESKKKAPKEAPMQEAKQRVQARYQAEMAALARRRHTA